LRKGRKRAKGDDFKGHQMVRTAVTKNSKSREGSPLSQISCNSLKKGLTTFGF
jgi:hypothetical protein